MFSYFKNSVHNSKPARDYIQQRGLDFTKLEIGYNTGQFHHGTRKEEALIQSCLKVGLLSPFGVNSRSGGQAYKPFAKECICFALRNRANQITGLYFRSTINNKDSRHFYLKDRSGLYPHYPKPDTKKLILTESIIDAATILQNEEVTKHYGILALYGTNGFTEEHTGAIKELKEIEEIIFFLNGDEAGRKATVKYAAALRILNPQIKITQVNVPDNEDVNSLAQAHEQSVFTHLLESRTLSISNESVPVKEEITQSLNQQITNNNSLNTQNPYKLIFVTDTAIYYIQGGVRSEADSMKVTLVIENPTNKKKSRNKLDLYEDKQIEKTAREVVPSAE
ncbi:MAG: toprim domain-containing protein, partial [Sphingobacteriales bacterium]